VIPPKRTIRLRLTILYGGLFVLAGAALLTITYLLDAGNVGGQIAGTNGQAVFFSTGPGELTAGGGPFPPAGLDPSQLKTYALNLAEQQHSAELRQLMIVSGLALVIMGALSLVLGWLVAGRALRPLRLMTGKARQISEANLHERLAVDGPDDELKELGDTFDGLLGRLDTAFAAQKRFVANASHELRTPLTLQRAMVEVALADPDADAASLRTVCEKVLVAGAEQERTIEALLTLARSQRGLDEWKPVDVAAIVTEVMAMHGTGAELLIEPAETLGDPRLVRRLVANLVDNAIRHNVPGGSIRVATGTLLGRPAVRVANSGPVIAPDRIGALFQPFMRMAERTGNGDGHGLGLSIVAAIADAHRADIVAAANPGGGLTVTVSFGYSRRVSNTSSTTVSPSFATR